MIARYFHCNKAKTAFSIIHFLIQAERKKKAAYAEYVPTYAAIQ